jgi:hypothetical protein
MADPAYFNYPQTLQGLHKDIPRMVDIYVAFLGLKDQFRNLVEVRSYGWYCAEAPLERSQTLC